MRRIRVPGIDNQAVEQLPFVAQSQGVIGSSTSSPAGRFEELRDLRPRDHAVHHGEPSSCRSSASRSRAGGVGSRKVPSGRCKITQWTCYLSIAIVMLQATGADLRVRLRRGRRPSPGAAQMFPNIVLLPEFMPCALLVVVATLGAGTALPYVDRRPHQPVWHRAMACRWSSSPRWCRGLPFAYYPILQEQEVVCVRSARLASLGILGRSCGSSSVNAGSRCSSRSACSLTAARYGGQNTYIPLKVNQAGIVPIISASSVLSAPGARLRVFGGGEDPDEGIVRGSPGHHTYIVNSQNIVYVTIFAHLIIAFSDFFKSIACRSLSSRPTSSASRVASFPASVQARQTERYLSKTVNRITLLGAVFVASLAITPHSSRGLFHADFPFAGTTVLIVVGVAARAHAPDRQPAHAAQLRGFPE